MTIQTVVKMGNTQLGTPSLPVENPSTMTVALQKIMQDMLDTMRAESGVGIAAPQIGCNQRIILFGFENNRRYPEEDNVPLTFLMNPVITILSDEQVDGWEGCLSVPGLRGLVPRYNQIEYSGFDQNGKKITRTAEGFHARVVQHECDHLDGILYPQRIKDLRFFGFEDELDFAMA